MVLWFPDHFSATYSSCSWCTFFRHTSCDLMTRWPCGRVQSKNTYNIHQHFTGFMLIRVLLDSAVATTDIEINNTWNAAPTTPPCYPAPIQYPYCGRKRRLVSTPNQTTPLTPLTRSGLRSVARLESPGADEQHGAASSASRTSSSSSHPAGSKSRLRRRLCRRGVGLCRIHAAPGPP